MYLLTDPLAIRFSNEDLMVQIVPRCALSHCSLDVEKPTVLILSWTLGIYGPDFFSTHEDKGKGVKAFNAIVSSSNITVVNDCRYFDGISSVNRFLSTHSCFRISWVGVLGLASARKLAPRYSGCPNAERLRSIKIVLPRTRF
jgi:hypothetical protein